MFIAEKKNDVFLRAPKPLVLVLVPARVSCGTIVCPVRNDTPTKTNIALRPQVLRRANQLDISLRVDRGGAARGRTTAEASPLARGGLVSAVFALACAGAAGAASDTTSTRWSLILSHSVRKGLARGGGMSGFNNTPGSCVQSKSTSRQAAHVPCAPPPLNVDREP